ncbi:MAG: hypothetical protein ABEJ69_03165 [Candidatus Nanohaloarchaea archaeon]
MRIALDLEGVLSDIHTEFLRDYNQEHGTSFSREDIDGWVFGTVRKHFNEIHGLEPGDTRAFLRGHGDWEGFYAVSENMWREDYERIPALFDSVPTIMSDEKFQVDIVTARKRVRKQLEQWLEANGIEKGRHFNRLRIEKHKHELDYDLFIDDNPALHRNLSSTGKHGILLEQPWNRSEDSAGAPRASTVEKAAEVIQDLD